MDARPCLAPECAQALNIGLNNWSLVFISLSINQLLRSIVPLPTAALATIFENKRFNWQVWASMGVVCVGAMLASYGSGNASFLGILVCLGSVFSGAAWTVVSGMLLQMGEEPLDSLTVLFCSSPTCIATTCAPLTPTHTRPSCPGHPLCRSSSGPRRCCC